ncbi:MAG: DUF2911 domain-containing protein [Chthoniobacterales bacterium]
MKRISLLLLPALLLAAASPLFAQEKQRISPHETVTEKVAGVEVSIVYGRPYTKDPKSGEMRKIWGTLVPYGKVWRMGADEATQMTTSDAIVIAGTTVPAGTYSLYLLPQDETSAKLIINKQTGQWGTKYDEAQDLVRVDLKKETIKTSADQFTIGITETDAAGVMNFSWDSTQYSVAFTPSKG